MQIKLRVAKPIGVTVRARDQFRAHHLDVKSVGAFPVRNMDDAMIELDGQRHDISFSMFSEILQGPQAGAAEGKHHSDQAVDRIASTLLPQ
jgi:hypothetical protein